MKSPFLSRLGLSVAAAALTLSGCSFSFSGGNVKTLKGKDAIVVETVRPRPKTPKLNSVHPPRKAVVVDKKIEIKEKIQFAYDEATIEEASFDLLNDVVAVINENPKIKKIRIEGHTDSDGTEKYNKELSQNRADAVKAYLVAHGIAADRLEAVGFGEEKPIADNSTDEGKEKNRRVEFNIVD